MPSLISKAISETSVAFRGNKNAVTHGMSYHPAYGAWSNALRRCCNPDCRAYADYGGRGITVCERWKTFAGFWEDMGPTWKPGLTLDRRDNNGNYEPGNCRWSTRKEQNRNQRKNRLINTPWGVMSMGEAAERTGLTPATLRGRLKRLGADYLERHEQTYPTYHPPKDGIEAGSGPIHTPDTSGPEPR